MKKTLTVNLGGRVFHIDEDAYQLLDRYLTNLRVHFSKEEGSEEILEDFENRISELFCEYLGQRSEVVTITQVEGVIKQMGKPEELFGEEFNQDEEEKKKSTTERIKETISKRLYRNPDDRILGGVASGVAAYMGWDPAIVRLGWFLLTFLYGVSVPLYFVLWIVVPLAQTATEKLQMRGESVTIENIGKTVTDGFDNLSEYIQSTKPQSIFNKFTNLIVDVIGILVKFVFVCMAIIFVPVMVLLLFLFLIIFGSLMVGGTALLLRMMPNINWEYFSGFPDGLLLTLSFCTILVVAIPLVSGIYAIISYFFKFKPTPGGIKWTLIIIWILALMTTIYTGSLFDVSWWGDMIHNLK